MQLNQSYKVRRTFRLQYQQPREVCNRLIPARLIAHLPLQQDWRTQEVRCHLRVRIVPHLLRLLQQLRGRPVLARLIPHFHLNSPCLHRRCGLRPGSSAGSGRRLNGAAIESAVGRRFCAERAVTSRPLEVSRKAPDSRNKFKSLNFPSGSTNFLSIIPVIVFVSVGLSALRGKML